MRRGWGFSGRAGAGDTWKRSRRGAEGGCSRRGADRGGKQGGKGGSVGGERGGWGNRNRGRGSAGPSLSLIGHETARGLYTREDGDGQKREW